MLPADKRSVAATDGYHPIPADLSEILRQGAFSDVLILGPSVPDIGELARNIRHLPDPPVELPEGVYWFSSAQPTASMLVGRGTAPSGSVREAPHRSRRVRVGRCPRLVRPPVARGVEVARPAFAVHESVVSLSGGEDGIVRARRYGGTRWLYDVFLGGRTQTLTEGAILPRPIVDAPPAWIKSAPAAAERLAATLTRAKLEGRFTDTVFSFRATRTIFRPYQFKPVMKLIGSNELRMLVADEVGLGKTIEAGLLWTELEARRQADRVLVVCPSALVAKWQREMEERFGFELTELTSAGLADLQARLEGGRVPKRAAYVCTVERLRRWKTLAEATELGLQFDLVIVDEAHVFRNAETKNHALGDHLSQWAHRLVFLSATPVNLRNQDLFNLLELLAPGEFQDLDSLQERIEPNAALNKITSSLLDQSVTNRQRRGWLRELTQTTFGRALTLRPTYGLLQQILDRDTLSVADVVQVKRACSELHGLASQITRTRKVEVQEDKAVREPNSVLVSWTDQELGFYEAYHRWCIQRAAVKDMPLHFAMQMPLRLAGSCLPEAAEMVRTWSTRSDIGVEVNIAKAGSAGGAGPDVPPPPSLVELARNLRVDTKLDAFDQVIDSLMAQGRQALVFTFSRRTLAYLQRHLQSRCRVAVLHGGIGKDERDRVMARFRAGEFDVVVATKVASEGLDFEFCSVLVNYDLPWNPMEIEQRIGRIDRIGQREEKIIITNFTTPGTIESDILEKVLDRIGIFEHAIGALEPIIESLWPKVEGALLDFTLTPAQREQRSHELLAALAEKERSLEEVESAAPFLISSDGVDIEGLQPELEDSGRYIGQYELALLVADWVKTYRGRATIDGSVLSITGNVELATHVQSLVKDGERTRAEVEDALADLRNEQAIHLSLDQEESRLGGTPLLTATHPLVRAAVTVPGHRQTRYSSLAMSPREARLLAGTYLVQLSVAHWDGIRPLHEVWTAAADAHTGRPVSDLGDRVMALLAQGSLRSSTSIGDGDLDAALASTEAALLARFDGREQELQAENRAFMETRLVGARQVHDRRIESIRERIATLQVRGRDRMIPLFQAQLRRENERHAVTEQELAIRAEATLTLENLAVCVVKVG